MNVWMLDGIKETRRGEKDERREGRKKRKEGRKDVNTSDF